MIPEDLKWFHPSEEETPAAIRIMDAFAVLGAAALGWAAIFLCAWVFG